MNTSRYFPLLASLFILIASCGKETPDPTPSPVPDTPVKEADKITLSGASEIVCSQEAQTKILSFETNAAWSVTCAVSWCTLSASSGNAGNISLTVSVNANEGYDERSCALVIKAGTASSVVNLVQKQKNALILTSDQFHVGVEGGSFEVEVKANIEYTIAPDADWIVPASTKALNTYTYSFSVLPNPGNEGREGHVIIRSSGLEETVTVSQDGREPFIRISEKELVVNAEETEAEIEVEANVPVSVKLNADWLSGSNETQKGVYKLKIAANESYDQRTSSVLFFNETCSITCELKVTQAQHDAVILAKGQYDISPEGGTLEIPVSTNMEPEVSVSEDARFWITYVQTKALQEKTLVFSIAPADESIDRTGTITVSGDGESQTVTIRQYQPALDNPVHFASEAFKQYCVKEFDRNADGEISFREALEIESIDMVSTDVESLEGIQHMPNLKVLRVSGNESYNLEPRGKIKEVDLSGNPNLEWLDLSIQQLQSIDLSKTPKLKSLNVWGNEIRHLDLSVTPLLDGADIASNGMLDVNLKGLEKVENMYLYGNAFESVDVSSLGNAAMLSLDWCGRLKKVVFPENAALKTFYCRNSAIEKLDVSYLPKLEELWCASENTQFLYVREGQQLSHVTTDRDAEYIHPNTVIITGSAKDDHLIVEKTYFELGPDGGQLSIPIVADNEVKVTMDADWISRPDAKVFKTGTLVLNVAAMPRGTNRSAKVKLQAGAREETISVNQIDADWISVASVTISPDSAEVKVGESITLTATVLPENATDKTVTWSSSNATIAGVDQNGTVTALANGSATIMAKVGEESAVCAVIVTTPVTGVSLNKDKIQLSPGKTATLTVTVYPLDATNQSVNWSSSNDSVASVSSGGVVTAKASGNATVTVKTVDGGKIATCLIMVSGNTESIDDNGNEYDWN